MEFVRTVFKIFDIFIERSGEKKRHDFTSSRKYFRLRKSRAGKKRLFDLNETNMSKTSQSLVSMTERVQSFSVQQPEQKCEFASFLNTRICSRMMRDALETRLKKGRQSVSGALGLEHWIVSGKKLVFFKRFTFQLYYGLFQLGLGYTKMQLSQINFQWYTITRGGNRSALTIFDEYRDAL